MQREKLAFHIFTFWNSHGLSVPEVISGRTHVSFRVFRELGQFREMAKSP